MSEEQILVGRVRARIGKIDYAVDLQAGKHRLVADEPASHGGDNAGPGPFSLLLSGLAACTAITLRMYAQRKGWNLTAVDVEAQLFRRGSESHIDRSISLHGDLDEAQTARLLEVSERTPVTLTLKGGVEIRTRLDQSGVT
jgi:putative redox protein